MELIALDRQRTQQKRPDYAYPIQERKEGSQMNRIESERIESCFIYRARDGSLSPKGILGKWEIVKEY